MVLVLLHRYEWPAHLAEDLVDVLAPSFHSGVLGHSAIVTVNQSFLLDHFDPRTRLQGIVGLLVELRVIADGADQVSVVNEIEAVITVGPGTT